MTDCRNCDGTGVEVYFWNDERRSAECRDCKGTGVEPVDDE